ncbi:MAG: hypothetical protein HYX43_16310 [Burkholderiales bacterium]|nr:hypothetical protein [Burkholderiales bacterium]
MKEIIGLTLNEENDGDISATFSEKPTTEQLDLLLRAIGGVRQETEPAQPDSPPTGALGLDVVSNPKWEVGQVFPHGRTLLLRHPMFGWLAFQMPEGLPEQIYQTLSATPPELPEDGMAKH